MALKTCWRSAILSIASLSEAVKRRQWWNLLHNLRSILYKCYMKEWSDTACSISFLHCTSFHTKKWKGLKIVRVIHTSKPITEYLSSRFSPRSTMYRRPLLFIRSRTMYGSSLHQGGVMTSALWTTGVLWGVGSAVGCSFGCAAKFSNGPLGLLMPISKSGTWLIKASSVTWPNTAIARVSNSSLGLITIEENRSIQAQQNGWLTRCWHQLSTGKTTGCSSQYVDGQHPSVWHSTPQIESLSKWTCGVAPTITASLPWNSKKTKEKNKVQQISCLWKSVFPTYVRGSKCFINTRQISNSIQHLSTTRRMCVSIWGSPKANLHILYKKTVFITNFQKSMSRHHTW